MGVVDKDKLNNLNEHLNYLNAVFTLVSKIATDGPRQEQIDEASTDYYFTKKEEKEAFDDLLKTARKFLISERTISTNYHLEEEREIYNKLRSYFNDLYDKFINPLSSFKEQEDRITYLTDEVLKNNK
jgi:hypothetical protein